jgi:hypothetical protein
MNRSTFDQMIETFEEFEIQHETQHEGPAVLVLNERVSTFARVEARQVAGLVEQLRDGRARHSCRQRDAGNSDAAWTRWPPDRNMLRKPTINAD